jgi:hypothetical protein
MRVSLAEIAVSAIFEAQAYVILGTRRQSHVRAAPADRQSHGALAQIQMQARQN